MTAYRDDLTAALAQVDALLPKDDRLGEAQPEVEHFDCTKTLQGIAEGLISSIRRAPEEWLWTVGSTTEMDWYAANKLEAYYRKPVGVKPVRWWFRHYGVLVYRVTHQTNNTGRPIFKDGVRVESKELWKVVDALQVLKLSNVVAQALKKVDQQ